MYGQLGTSKVPKSMTFRIYFYIASIIAFILIVKQCGVERKEGRKDEGRHTVKG